MNTNEIIEDAYRRVGLGIYETVEGEYFTPALRALNNMAKAWQADPYNLWKRKEVTVFLENTASYSLGSETTDAHWAETWYSTLLNGAVVSGATSIVVDSYTNMSKDMFIGIELSDGTRQWTTIKSTPSSTTVSLSDALGAASDNATVFFYSARPNRPQEILHARRKEYNGSDIPVEIVSVNDYQDKPSKNMTGTPVEVAYSPTRTSGTLYTWLKSNSVRMVLGLSIKETFTEFTSESVPDFPEEWYECLVYNLADRLEPTVRILDQQRRQELKQEARNKYAEMLMYDAEDGSIRFG